jgi:hypothetical protein
MEGVKLSGLSSQIPAFEQLLAVLNISYLPIPTNLTEIAVALQKFKAFASELRGIQNTLAKPFPFIIEIAVEPDVSENSKEKEESSHIASFNLFGGRVVTIPRAFTNISKLTDMVTTVGKSVRKYAETGFQRLGAIPAKVPADELAYLASVISNVCVRSEGLENWVAFLEAERSGQSVAATLPADQREVWLNHVESLLFEHVFVSGFLMQVICELMLRDMELLAQRYMKKLRKSFTTLADFPDEEQDESGEGKVGSGPPPTHSAQSLS